MDTKPRNRMLKSARGHGTADTAPANAGVEAKTPLCVRKRRCGRETAVAPKIVRSQLDGAQTPRPRLSAVARFGGETNNDEAEDQNGQPR
jgi:hypothetical protein